MRKKKTTPTLLTDSAMSLTDLKTRSMQELMELAEQFEVDGIPLLLLFQNGRPVKSASGFRPKEALRSLLD